MPAEDNGNKKGCGSGSPCIYVDRHKWIPWEDIEYSHYSPPKIKSDSWKKSDSTMFIMIASFRDKLCPHTLFNAFSKAQHPSRIHIGVVDQSLEDDVNCVQEYCRLIQRANPSKDGKCPFIDNIRVAQKNAQESKGPTWARAIGSTLLEDEEFCLQLDSHMDFVPQWDIKMMEMWAMTDNEYAILSTYVTDAVELSKQLDGQKGVNGLFEVPHLCMVTLDGANGLVRNWATKSCRMLPKPKLTNGVWGAGLSFSKCHAERKVMYDPHTPHIFDGEEFSRAMRYWTYGYDIYSPHRVHIVHNYVVSQSDPKHMAWFGGDEPGSADTMESAVSRMKALMGLPDGPRNDTKTLLLRQSKYGLGDRRSLDQFIAFSGIDTINRRIIENRCGNIEFVPFKEHPLGPNYIPKFDPVTEYYADKWYDGSIYSSDSRSNNNALLPLPKTPPTQLVRIIDPPVSTQMSNVDSKISLVYTKKIFELPLQSVPTEELITGSTLLIAVCVVITLFVCLLRKPVVVSSSSGSSGSSSGSHSRSTRIKQPEFSKNV